MADNKLRLDLHYRGSIAQATELAQNIAQIVDLKSPRIIFGIDKRPCDAAKSGETITIKGIYMSGYPMLDARLAVIHLQGIFNRAQFEECMGSKWKPTIDSNASPVVHVRFGS